MSELIEKVAKAICNDNWEYKDHWEECASDADKEHFRVVARAAIAAVHRLLAEYAVGREWFKTTPDVVRAAVEQHSSIFDPQTKF